jgi:acyl-CoA synthetase (AMP-forming)/AMP-acid ligase II
MGLNPRYTPLELKDLIARAGPKLVIYDPADATSVLPDALRPGAAPPLAFEAAGEAASGEEPSDLAAGDAALLVYTTGSTGRPKGALLSHVGLATVSEAQASRVHPPRARVLNVLPTNHIGSIVNVTTSTIWNGGEVVCAPRFSPAAVAAAISRRRVQMWTGVPAMFQLCLDDPVFAGADLSSLELVLSGGARMPERTFEALSARGLKVRGMYGQTEMTGSLCYTDEDAPGRIVTDTIGKPERRFDVRLCPPDGALCDHAEGEIQVRGDLVMLGYRDDPASTASAFTGDGWLRSGDLAVRTAEGDFRLVGRLKEMINTGGYKVLPREIEEALTAHPGVAQAAVVSRPDPVFGEAIVAFVTSVDGKDDLVADLLHWCAERLAHYKRPKRIRRLDAFPLIGVGKVDRRALTAMAATDE